MKRLITTIILVATLIPVTASALNYHHRQQRFAPSIASIPTSPAPIGIQVVDAGFCFDFGHDVISNVAQVTAELTQLSKYSNCIRLAYNGSNNLLSESDALLAKSMGIRVIIGNDTGTFSASSESSYTAQVIQEAKWAQQNGIPQIGLDNEQESRLLGLSVCQWNTYLGSLYTQVRAVYAGTISYEMNSEYLSQYIGCGQIQGLLYGLNLYAGYVYNSQTLQQAINAFGISHVYVSETGPDMSTGNYGTDALRAAEVKNDAVLLIKNFSSTPIYFFTWSANGQDGVPAYWGIDNDPLTLAEI